MSGRWTEILGERLDAPGRELVTAATALVPLLAANADRADAEGRIPEENLAALREAGLLRLGVPRALGGHGVRVGTLLAVCTELGRGCASTAWVTALFGSGGAVAGLVGDAVRAEIWGSSPDITLSSAVGVPVPVRQVSGGYVLDGRWGWVSGIRHSDWVGLDVLGEREGGSAQRAMAFVPVTAVSVEDTWDMAGMRGTGSDTVVAEDLFVPDDRMLWFADAAAGVYHRGGDGEMATRLLFPVTAMVSFVAPVLGLGVAVYEHIVGILTAGRSVVSGSRLHDLARDTPGVQAGVVDAAALIDGAMLRMAWAAGELDRAALAGVIPPETAGVRMRVDFAHAARSIRQAADMLLDVGGASRFALADPAQRMWRDLGTATRHPAFVTEVNRERYGQLLLAE
ncbi:acyl-CoA dehydrogenase family protein [Streptomyces sp. NPDC058653]|uniref:acyl-CoA dehydrogenase family protein n=1 Tax=Streptomyces sp. NPDC058653 TaxID=3346576 RepID=UPI003667ECFB